MNDIRKDMRDLRRDFEFGTLDAKDVPENPFLFLKQWMKDAVELNIKDANAFVLSTSNNGQPDSRVLLIRDITATEIHFYTNYSSKKSEDIANNKKASLNIFWPDMDRQIRIHATLEKISPELSDDYFKTRPRGSQIGAWASMQSKRLESRAQLEQRIEELEKEFEGKEIPRPDFWGGYAAVPNYFEFWQGRPSRLHDRITFQMEDLKWKVNRLFP